MERLGSAVLTQDCASGQRVFVPLVDGEEGDVLDVLILDAIAAAEEAQGEGE